MVKAILLGRGPRVLIALAVALGALLLSGCGVETATPAGSQGNARNAQASPPVRQSSAAEAGTLAGTDADTQDRVAARGNTGIWVTGRGEATAVPDLAVLSLGIEAFATTVQQARAEAGAAMDRVIGVLKARKVADRDIQTRHFNIAPRYSSRKVSRCIDGGGPRPPGVEPRPAPPMPPVPPPFPPPAGPPPVKPPGVGAPAPFPPQGLPRNLGECFEEYQQVILGYQVTNQLTIKLRDLNAIGGIIDTATEAGGDLTRLGGISFTIDDPRALETQARAAAIADLQAKAKQFATLSGVKLGQLRFITETSGAAPLRQLAELGIAAAPPLPGAPTLIRPGELGVVVTVQGVFAIE